MIQTQTIDISFVKEVFDRCPNYDFIVNYTCDDGDILSIKLIDWYKDLIFSINRNSDNQLKIITILDKSLFLYLKDHKYSKGLRKILNEKDINLNNQEIIKNAIIKIIKYTNDYENDSILNISSSRWL